MRVAVVGAGFGGLAAALELGTQGAEVTVFERHHRAGGKADQVQVDGVGYDTGPSVLTMTEYIDPIFERAGTSLRECVDLVSHGPAFDYRFADGVRLCTHTALQDTVDSVREALGDEAAREFTDFLSYSEGIWSLAAPHFVLGEAPRLSRLLSPRLVTQVKKLDPMNTMWSAIQSRVRTPALRTLLARYATYNGSDVRHAPATLNCIAHVELQRGAYGVRGGVARVADAMVNVAQRQGATFAFGCEVTRIASRRPGYEITAGSDVTPVDAVVFNGTHQNLQRVLGLGTGRRGKRPPRSMSAWNFLFRDGKHALEAPHTVLFPEHYLREFQDIFDGERTPEDPTVYACDLRAAHELSGPGEMVFTMVNAPALPNGDPCTAEKVETRVRRRLRAQGLLSDGAECVWSRSPGDLETRFPGSDGALYGAASNSQFSAFKRPAARVQKGVYFASGEGHPGGGVPMAMLSGVNAVRALVKDF